MLSMRQTYVPLAIHTQLQCCGNPEIISRRAAIVLTKSIWFSYAYKYHIYVFSQIPHRHLSPSSRFFYIFSMCGTLKMLVLISI